MMIRTAKDARLRCPMCDCIHKLKNSKKGEEFFSCPTMGYSTNVFFQTPKGKELGEAWKQNAFTPGTARTGRYARSSARNERGKALKQVLEEYRRSRR